MIKKELIGKRLFAAWLAAVLVMQGAAPAVYAEEIENQSVSQENWEQPAAAEPEVYEEVAYEEAAPVVYEEAAPAATEEAAPAATEEAAPAATEEAAPAATEESAPAATEESAPAATEESAPAATEESAPAAAEESAPAATEEAAPAEAEEGAPASSAEAAPEQEASSEADNADGAAESSAEAAAPEEKKAGGLSETASDAAESASEEAMLAASSGVYYYGSKEEKKDVKDTYIYDDDLLKGDSKVYKPELATMSLSMVNASIGSIRSKDYANKSQNLRIFLEDNGFSDFEVNEDYQKEPTLTTMGVACAHKQIKDNGKTYTLLVIAPRSAGYKTEWGGNFDVGADGDHEGFEHAMNIVLAFAREYVQKHGIKGDIKVWTAGGSRGAGVINLFGAELLRDSAALGDSVTLTPGNLYCYTFGTPKAADSTSEDFKNNNESLYAYIHNLSEANDVVGTFAPEDLGFDRYGDTKGYVDPGLKDDMLRFLEATSEAMYKVFTEGGGDPENFKALDIDFEKLITDRQIGMTAGNENNYLSGMTQADYMDLLEGTMASVFKDRETYVKDFQEPMKHFFGYIYGGSGELGTLFNGVKKSGYMLPTVASMYISVVLQHYMESESAADSTIADLNEAIGELDKVIAEMEQNGETLSQEIKNSYQELKSSLALAQARKDLNDALVNASWQIAADFYSKAMKSALQPITTITDENKALLASDQDSRAMTKIMANLLLVDPAQTEKFGFHQLGQQFEHLATTIGNAKSFMIPHYNEVILAWLRASDPNYSDFKKADNAQATGYRRIYMEQPEGVDVTGTVKDSAGNVVAVFKNGNLESSTSKWIGMTTSDGGSWLRLPLDDTYKIDFTASEDTKINIKVSEYSVDDGKEVRVETADSKYSWKDLAIRTVDSASLIVSEIEGKDGIYALDSGAAYYLDLLRRYYITYMLEGGSLDGSKGSVPFLYNDGTQITLPTPVRDGYEFAYWEGSRYNAGDSYTVLGDHIFKAIWNKIAEDIDNPDKPDDEKPGDNTDSEPEKPENTDSETEDPENTDSETPGNTESESEESDGKQEESVPAPAAVNARRTSAPAAAQQTVPARTADTNPLAFWFLMMAASMSAAAALLAGDRKKKRHD